MTPSRASPLLGIDELKLVVRAITPEYVWNPNVIIADYLRLRLVLSKDARTTLCSLSLTCRALRSDSQRALMQYLSLGGSSVPEVVELLISRYGDAGMFPVRKLCLHGKEGHHATQEVLMSLLKSCKRLEYLLTSGTLLTGLLWDDLLPPKTRFKYLETLVINNTTPIMIDIFASMIAMMPCLKHLVTTAIADTNQKALAEPAFQLESLSLSDDWGCNFARFDWLLSKSLRSIHTLQLSWMNEEEEWFGSLKDILEIAGSRLHILHIWGGEFQPTSVASLVSICPNLQELGVERIGFEPIKEEDSEGELDQRDLISETEEEDDADPTMLCINSLHSPILRLHIISAYSGRTLGPPALCRALWKDHAMLAKLESISFAINEYGNVKRYVPSLTTRGGMLAVCQAKGVKLRCSTYDDVIEWECE